MARGVKSLNNLSQALKTQSHPDQKPSYDVEIGDVLHEALIITQGKLSKQTVITEISELPLCSCYRSRLGQVFINLLSNAGDALEEKASKESLNGRDFEGKILIEAQTSTQNDTTGIQISFSDNGPGIDPQTQPHVFTEFFTTKAPGQGTGLGLSLSKKIIEAHNGSISVEPSAQGGAKFTVWIPIEVSDDNLTVLNQ